jgi:outer membrane assembly lipoprotein YfiO
MRKAAVSAYLVAALWAAVPAARAQTQTQTFQYSGRGQWAPVAATRAAAAATQVAPDPTLDRVEDLLRRNQNKSAEKLAIQWVLAHKSSPQRDRGLYLIARALYQYGNRLRAFYYLDELLDEYPESRLYYPALELQYTIADRYLDGYKRRFLGLPMFHAYDEAIEMLFRIQQRSPGSQLAEHALLRTANFYYANQDYDFASDTYAAYMRTYPRSPMLDRIKLRYAYSLYAQFRGPKFDATPVIDAREQLREIVQQYPKLAEEENIPSLVAQLDRNLARKLFVTGDFYRRTHEPRGAAYTFRYLAKAYPQTPEAQAAQKELAKLPQWALNATPEPAITPGYAPPTPPQEPPRMAPGQLGGSPGQIGGSPTAPLPPIR